MDENDTLSEKLRPCDFEFFGCLGLWAIRLRFGLEHFHSSLADAGLQANFF
jgi:hypothetical protein